jgi:hypothetical protein
MMLESVFPPTRTVVSKGFSPAEQKHQPRTRQGVRDLSLLGPRGTSGGRTRPPRPPLYCSHVWVKKQMVDTPYGLVYDDHPVALFITVCAKCGAPRGA